MRSIIIMPYCNLIIVWNRKFTVTPLFTGEITMGIYCASAIIYPMSRLFRGEH
jgi:hypothetical protein